MSVERTETIDAATARDGYAVLSIHQFDDWEPADERVEQLRHKLATYERFLATPRYLAHFHALPVRIELVTSSPPPEEVRRICRQWNVELSEPVDDE